MNLPRYVLIDNMVLYDKLTGHYTILPINGGVDLEILRDGYSEVTLTLDVEMFRGGIEEFQTSELKKVILR